VLIGAPPPPGGVEPVPVPVSAPGAAPELVLGGAVTGAPPAADGAPAGEPLLWGVEL
jgi:hypothetical protein